MAMSSPESLGRDETTNEADDRPLELETNPELTDETIRKLAEVDEDTPVFHISNDDRLRTITNQSIENIF
jgi:hypothetical protein